MREAFIFVTALGGVCSAYLGWGQYKRGNSIMWPVLFTIISWGTTIAMLLGF